MYSLTPIGEAFSLIFGVSLQLIILWLVFTVYLSYITSDQASEMLLHTKISLCRES